MTFMKTFLAALLAFVVAQMIIGLLTFMMFAGALSMFSTAMPTVSNESILKIDFSDGITDSPSNSPLTRIGLIGFDINNSNTILDALLAIERATNDDKIKGVYINITGGSISTANMEELRRALLTFKESGKFVISYSDAYSQRAYYFSSVADRVYLNPVGEVDWKGMSTSVMFYKGLIDKLGLEIEIFRHGTFKAAVEPFMLDKMSPENRLQMNTIGNTLWGTFLQDVSLSRGIDSAVLSNYATELAVSEVSAAVKYGMVDAAIYEDQVMDILSRLSLKGESIENAERAVVGGSQVIESAESAVVDASQQAVEGEQPVAELQTASKRGEEKDPKFISLRNYIAIGAISGVANKSKNRIAIIYADGEIVDGESGQNSIGGATIAGKIASARKNKDVKAIVLRVNSPGGSALASEVIWREMIKAKEQIPVIVSMGNLAASGGYYIAAPADVILANRTTLTGSIGVFGMLLNYGGALKNKLGVTVDVVKTNPSADYGQPYRNSTPFEKEMIQSGVERVYQTFIGHVAQGRNLDLDYVDEIGGGRVWSGVSALDIGLIDGYGGLQDAIGLAADRAGVSGDFRILEVVDAPSGVLAMLRSLGGIKTKMMEDELGEMLIHYNAVKNMVENHNTVQAMMPYAIEVY